MLLRFALAPWRVQWLVYSAGYLAVIALVTSVTGTEHLNWVWLVISAVAYGLITTPYLAGKSHRELGPVLARVAPQHYRQVSKAARGGPPPTDPVILDAAARVAHLYAQRGRNGSAAIPILCLALLAALGQLTVKHTIHVQNVVAAAAIGFLGAYSWLTPKLWEARAALLLHAAGQHPLPSSSTDVRGV
ncbi:MAG: hypothetical protein ACRDUS_20585 [Mycobacterium sp.]